MRSISIITISIITFCLSCTSKKEVSQQNNAEAQEAITQEKTVLKEEENMDFSNSMNSEKKADSTKIASMQKEANADTQIKKEGSTDIKIDSLTNDQKIGQERKLGDKDFKPAKKENNGFAPVVNEQSDKQPIVPKKPPVIIYKMKADYSNNIPVILSADKKTVVRYPAPGDLFFEGKISRPTKLANGFYLDNRGVNENVAFTSYTYDDYLNLKKAPTAQELFNIIIDADPLLEIYQLKDIGRDPEALNEIIKSGSLPKNYAE